MRPLIISLETGIASRRAIRSMPFCSDKGLSQFAAKIGIKLGRI
ncbi:MAG: hypothetical protein AABY79_05960 [Nitrospirota bacterium]